MPEPGSSDGAGREPEAMPAEFGLATATFLIVASMVGTGVLTTSGYTVLGVGSNQLMLGLWVLGGLAAACGALTLCELTAALPRSGGDYVYLQEAYGPVVAFLSGWVSFLIGFAAPAAVSAVAAAIYLTEPLKLGGDLATYLPRMLATTLIVVFGLIHTSGRKRTAYVQGWITVVKLAILFVFIVAGLIAGHSHLANLADPLPITTDRLVTMFSSLVYISYAYTGWNAASYLAGEFVDPQRKLPRAILQAMAGVIVLYLALNVVYALALSAADVKAIVTNPANLKGADAVAPVASLAAERLFSPRISKPFTVAIGLMLLSSLSAYLLAGPRVIYAMAVAGQFPAIAGKLTRRQSTPGVATALQGAITILLVWVGSPDRLIRYAGVGLAIFSMLAVASVYVLRWKRPGLARPFRTPGYPITPAIYLTLTAALTLASFLREWLISTFALLSILAGIPVYYLWQSLKRPPSSVSTPAQDRMP